MPAAAIEEARESVLGVSLEYAPRGCCLVALQSVALIHLLLLRYKELEQAKAKGGAARLAPLA